MAERETFIVKAVSIDGTKILAKKTVYSPSIVDYWINDFRLHYARATITVNDEPVGDPVVAPLLGLSGIIDRCN